MSVLAQGIGSRDGIYALALEEEREVGDLMPGTHVTIQVELRYRLIW